MSGAGEKLSGMLFVATRRTHGGPVSSAGEKLSGMLFVATRSTHGGPVSSVQVVQCPGGPVSRWSKFGGGEKGPSGGGLLDT